MNVNYRYENKQIFFSPKLYQYLSIIQKDFAYQYMYIYLNYIPENYYEFTSVDISDAYVLRKYVPISITIFSHFCLLIDFAGLTA